MPNAHNMAFGFSSSFASFCNRLRWRVGEIMRADVVFLII